MQVATHLLKELDLLITQHLIIRLKLDDVLADLRLCVKVVDHAGLILEV